MMPPSGRPAPSTSTTNTTFMLVFLLRDEGDLSEAEEWGGACRGSLLQHHLNHQLWRAAEKLAWLGRGLCPRKLVIVSPPTPNFLRGCLCAKAEAWSLLFFLFVRVLIFGNAQLCLYAGQNVNSQKTDTVVYHNVFCFFFFCMYMRITRIKECNGFHLDLGLALMDLICG